MNWLTDTPLGFELFTNHDIPGSLFYYLSVMPELSQTSIRKIAYSKKNYHSLKQFQESTTGKPQEHGLSLENSERNFMDSI